MSLIATALVDGKKGFAQTIQSGHHRLTADEPERTGGTDTGPTPYGLLASALGACTSITLRMYADRKGWDLGEVRVAVRHFKEGDTDRIEREIHFSAPLTDDQRERLLEVAEKTPVTKTIASGSRIETKID